MTKRSVSCESDRVALALLGRARESRDHKGFVLDDA